MKCSHDVCNQEQEEGSPYCSHCIQLPTKECNYCNYPTRYQEVKTRRRKIREIAGALAPIVLFIIVIVFIAWVFYASVFDVTSVTGLSGLFLVGVMLFVFGSLTTVLLTSMLCGPGPLLGFVTIGAGVLLIVIDYFIV